MSEWKMVPTQPTKEMKEIGARAGDCGMDFSHHIYYSMVAAAPTPPAPQPMTDEDIMRIAWVNGLLGFSNWNYSPAQSCPSSVLSFAKALLAAQEGK